MARKRYKPEEIVAKLRQVDVLVSQGQIKWLILRVRKLPMEAAFLCPVSKGNRTFP